MRAKLLKLRNGRDEDALPALLHVYGERADLNEVFPEAQRGEYGRLIDWAADVTAKKWADPALGALERYAGWYAARATGKPLPPSQVDWPVIERTSAAAANPLTASLSAMRAPPFDIGNHLPTLSLLVAEFELRNVVELGTRTGISTVTFLEAAARIGGNVLSIDPEPCPEAAERVAHAGMGELWRFLQASDLDVPAAELPTPIDLLFIDTTHLYEHTLEELRRFSRHLRAGSWIALHDYVACPGVARASEEFVASLPVRASFYPFPHQNGLALLRLLEAPR